MIEYNAEKYVSASEVARSFKISHRTCSINVLPTLTECHLPGRKHAVYRLTEVEALSQVRIVEKQPQPSILVREAAS